MWILPPVRQAKSQINKILGAISLLSGRLVDADGTNIDPYEFTKAEFNNLVSTDYTGIDVRITDVHQTAAGVGGVTFIGGASWICTSPQIYYATRAAGVAAFPAASYPGLRQVWGDVGGGRSPVVSNGTRYVPESGRMVLFRSVYGTLAIPTLTAAAGSTSFNFALESPTIPANMLAAGDALYLKGRVQKHGTAAVIPIECNIGTAGDTNDHNIIVVNVPNTDLNHMAFDAYADVCDATHFITNNTALQGGTGGAGFLLDRTTNFNIVSAMIFSINGTKNTADSLDLISWQLEWITAP